MRRGQRWGAIERTRDRVYSSGLMTNPLSSLG